jgi:chitinase
VLKPTSPSEAGLGVSISLPTSQPLQIEQHSSRPCQISPQNTTSMVSSSSKFIPATHTSRVNFSNSWEYPNHQGIGCNTISANDTSNFLAFLQELRLDPIGAKLTISAAVALTPFKDASGNPSTDVSGFAEVFDYIALMNYDVWGSWM